MRLETGVYRDASGIAVIANVGGHQKEIRLDANATRPEWLKARAQLLEELGAAHPQKGPAGTLRRDVPRYLALVETARRLGEQKAHCNAWLDELGDVPRRRITRHEILRVRGKMDHRRRRPEDRQQPRVSAARALAHARR